MTLRIASLLLAGVLLLAGSLFTGCTDDPIYPEKGIRITAANIPAITGDAYYELWFSYPKSEADPKPMRPEHDDDNFISIGKFRVDDAGNLTGINGGGAVFNTPAGFNPSLYKNAILTVESTAVMDTVPGPTLLAGPLWYEGSLGRDTLLLNDTNAFGPGILRGNETGSFILDTPTGDSAAPNGIWFVRFADPTGGIENAIPGLLLPSQPTNENNPNWAYQVWLTRNRDGLPIEYIPLGRFNNSTDADSTGAGPGAGAFPTRIYPSPGEDFVTGIPRTLNDGTYGVVVSAEPTTLSLGRPLLPLLMLERIAAGILPRTTLYATAPTGRPRIEVAIDR